MSKIFPTFKKIFIVFRRLTLILGAFFVILMSLFLSLLFFIFPIKTIKCFEERKVIASPNNINKANLLTGGCQVFAGADSFTPRVTIQTSGTGPNDATEVYRGTRIDVPVWLSDNRLQITITEAGKVEKSSHHFDNITIIYHLADSLLQENFTRGLELYEQNSTKAIESQQRMSEEDRSHRLAKLQDRVREMRTRYQNFKKEWANKNTDNGLEVK